MVGQGSAKVRRLIVCAGKARYYHVLARALKCAHGLLPEGGRCFGFGGAAKEAWGEMVECGVLNSFGEAPARRTCRRESTRTR